MKENLQSGTTILDYETCPFRLINAEVMYPDHTNQRRIELRNVKVDRGSFWQVLLPLLVSETGYDTDLEVKANKTRN